MNCEFQSMQIAQQKLSVTRDLQKASQDYQTNLQATKLVWDTMDDDVYDLTYDMMMQPSAINQYDPYLVTDLNGKIVLSNAMYDAAVKAGIIDKDTGKPTGNSLLTMGKTDATSDGSRNAFLYQLGLINQIDVSSISSIHDLGNSGYTLSGVGGEVYDKSTANALSSTAFINYLKEAKYDDNIIATTGNTSVKKGDSIYNVNLFDALGMGNSGKQLNTSKDFNNSSDAPAEQFIVTQNGQAMSEESLKKLTLGDILSGKYELSYKGTDEAEIKNVMIKALEAMATALGYGDSTHITGLNVDVESDMALEQAYEFTKMLLNSKTEKTASVSDMCKEAQGVNQLVYGNNIGTISLTNMLKSFLTNFAIAIDGFDCGFNVEKTSAKKSFYATDDLNYYFLLKNDGAITEQNMLLADFYNMLYNQLCINGACTDANKRELITDKEYLGHALKNGQLFISSLNNDGYFYQGAYTQNGHVAEVPDEEARTQAELDYNVTKSKLNYKEETLELQMKSLDAEISALSTEYDTVKSLISKNIEKVFTMFSS